MQQGKMQKMKTITLEVADLTSILDFAAVEKRLVGFPGVYHVAMNAGSSTASIDYDEGKTNPEQLAEQIKACGFHCRGETAPRHVCVPDSIVVPPGSPKAPSQADHERHGPEVPPAIGAEHAAHQGHGIGTVAPAPAKPAHDAMAHEMGHGAGMDMRDWRATCGIAS